MWAAGPAPVRLCEGVGTLGERLRVQGEEPRDERVVRGRKKVQRDGFSQALRSASADTICRSATVDSEALRARAAERERSSTPSAFIITPGACRYSGGAAPTSMNRRLCRRATFWSAGERNDPFWRLHPGGDCTQAVTADQNGVVSERVQSGSLESQQASPCAPPDSLGAPTG